MRGGGGGRWLGVAWLRAAAHPTARRECCGLLRASTSPQHYLMGLPPSSSKVVRNSHRLQPALACAMARASDSRFISSPVRTRSKKPARPGRDTAGRERTADSAYQPAHQPAQRASMACDTCLLAYAPGLARAHMQAAAAQRHQCKCNTRPGKVAAGVSSTGRTGWRLCRPRQPPLLPEAAPLPHSSGKRTIVRVAQLGRAPGSVLTTASAGRGAMRASSHTEDHAQPQASLPPLGSREGRQQAHQSPGPPSGGRGCCAGATSRARPPS